MSSVSSANQRSALAALDAARPAIARLDAGRHPEDVAADLIESWSAVETALRSLLGGSGLGGQSLVSEARQRGFLDYPHAHALLGFLAAHDRASRPDYQPGASDLEAARAGFQALEAALGVGISADTGMFQAVRPLEPITATTPAAPTAGSAATGAFGTTASRPLPPPVSPPLSTRRTPEPEPVPDYVPRGRGATGRGPIALVVGALVALIALAAVGAWMLSESREPRALRSGIAEYAQGRRESAKRQFQEAATAHPKLALPHVYLARMAREDGDLQRANAELQTAVRLDPQNALANAEMGRYLLQAGNPQLATRFFERAIRVDPADRASQGWMGCALVRQGRTDLAQSWFQRAGQGDWSACANAAPAGAGFPAGARPSAVPGMPVPGTVQGPPPVVYPPPAPRAP